MKVRKPTFEDVFWLGLPAAMMALVASVIRLGPHWFLPVLAVLCVVTSATVGHYAGAGEGGPGRIPVGLGLGNAITMMCVSAAMFASTSDPGAGAPLPLGVLALASGAAVLAWTTWMASHGSQDARRP